MTLTNIQTESTCKNKWGGGGKPIIFHTNFYSISIVLVSCATKKEDVGNLLTKKVILCFIYPEADRAIKAHLIFDMKKN